MSLAAEKAAVRIKNMTANIDFRGTFTLSSTNRVLGSPFGKPAGQTS
jgi:hypothetical protein